MTTTKKCLKNATGTQKKRSLETDYQDDDEIIDIDEVRKRNGITGEKKHYFIACLRTYYEDDEFNSYVKSLTGLAKYIADWRIFYVNTHHGYRLMKFRSILSEISSLSKIARIIGAKKYNLYFCPRFLDKEMNELSGRNYSVTITAR